VELPEPAIPECQPWSKNDQLKNEKEVTGFYISGHPLDDHKIEIETFCNVTLEDLHSGLLKYKMKTIVFAGKVNSSEQKTARSGNLFGTFELEDFTDTMKFTLFSEDFLKFKHLLFEGAHVLVQARVVLNRINPNRLDIQVNNIMLLAEASERLAKALNLYISLADLTEELIKELSKIIRNNPGKCDLLIKIKDPEEGYSLEMHPLKHKVNPASVVRALLHHQKVEYKLSGNARNGNL